MSDMSGNRYVASGGGAHLADLGAEGFAERVCAIDMGVVFYSSKTNLITRAGRPQFLFVWTKKGLRWGPKGGWVTEKSAS